MENRQAQITVLSKLILSFLLLSNLFAGCGRDPNPTPPDRSFPAKTTHIRAATELPLPILTLGADGFDGAPILFAFHGLGDWPENFAALFAPLAPKAHILLPTAPTPYGRGFSWFETAVPLRRSQAADISREVQARANQICQLITQQTPNEQVVVTGFSQGAVISYALAATCPERIRCALPVAGMLPQQLIPPPGTLGPKPRIIAFHGDGDGVVPYSWDSTTVDQFKQAGYPIRLITYPGVGHRIAQNETSRLMTELNNCLYPPKTE